MDYPHKKSLQLTIRPLCSEIVFDSPQYGVMFFSMTPPPKKNKNTTFHPKNRANFQQPLPEVHANCFIFRDLWM